MRTIDDKIIYALNTSIPTDSFRGQIDATKKCKELHQQLNKSRSDREEAIKKCLVVAADRVKRLKKDREVNSDDFNLIKKLRSEQTKVMYL